MIKGFLYQTIGIDLRGNYQGNPAYAKNSMDYSNPIYGMDEQKKSVLPRVIQDQKDLVGKMQLIYSSNQFQDNTRHHNQRSA